MTLAADVTAPFDEAGIETVIREQVETRAPLAIWGAGTRAGLGRPVEAAAALSTARLTGVTLFEPSELVIAAKAGTPIAEVEAELARAGQRLAFEPFDHRPLYGTAGEPTIGGLVATNASGPRRVQTGAARDALIGVRLVTGRGETIRAGGRVMKNVTGYDITKLAAGSHGTLGVVTEATFKTLPIAESETTLVIQGLDDAHGVAALCAGMGSPFEVSGAAHLPGAGGAPSRTLLRLENFANQLRYRANELADRLLSFGAADRLAPDDSRALWRSVAQAAPHLGSPDRAVWRVSVAPTRAPGLIALLGDLALAHVYDWSGGLIWIATPAEGDAGAGR
ncbi:FAD-binding protein, partial [Methylopila musalis]